MFSFIKRKIKSAGRKLQAKREQDYLRRQAQVRAKDLYKQKQVAAEARRKQLKSEAQAREKRVRAKVEAKRKAVEAKHKMLQDDMEVAKKYIVKRSEKALFAEDMGQRKAKGRTAIPKTISLNGVTYSKYTSYEHDLSSAQEASEDMKEMGYRTCVKQFKRGSEPVYVLYRYKKGRTSSVSAKIRKNPAKTAKRKIKKRRS